MTTTYAVKFRCYACGGWSTDPENCTTCGQEHAPMTISRKASEVRPVRGDLGEHTCWHCAQHYLCPLEEVTKERDRLHQIAARALLRVAELELQLME